MLDTVNVIAELELAQITYTWASDTEVKCLCPFHDDSSPSCFVNIQKRTFICHTAGCAEGNKGGDIATFIARTLGITRSLFMIDLSKRYNIDSSKLIDPQVIERYHNALWGQDSLLQELHKRGVTDELIRKYRLGYVDGRISIPVDNEAGFYVNIRKYLPGAPGKDKMRNLKGHGKVRLFPVKQMAYKRVMICGGELKAIVAAEQLNPHGIGAICATAGERNFDIELAKRFSDKEEIYVCLDVDYAGQLAAHAHCAQFSKFTDTYHVTLPLDTNDYPKGDINDFVHLGGDLYDCIEKAELWVPQVLSKFSEDTPPEPVDLQTAINARTTGKRIEVTAVVAAMDPAPYVVPKTVRVVCDKSQKDCALCSVFSASSDQFSIPAESPSVLEMVNSTKSRLREAVCGGLGIPKSCAVVELEPTEYFNIEDVRISPQLEITTRSADRVMQPAICIGEGLELNETYKLTGRMYPHPMTQQSTLLISNYEPTQDALSSYKPENLDELALFQPKDWTSESVHSKLTDIYDDFAVNVTRIYYRQMMHFVVDLIYHSPLFITFDDRVVKGWTEGLIVGDSSLGKSETTKGMLDHYGLGVKFDCKNATVAGILGGLRQEGNKWFVSWGIVPTHDKRLVVFEELKGASTEIIAKLTDMRSSGFAEIPKIEKRRTFARTRLLMLSNPRGDRKLSTYSFNIEAIRELIGSQEDIRRFDIALIISNKDIDAELLNKTQNDRPKFPHKYLGPLCRNLILWAWTREPHQVVFDETTTKMCLESATQLCSKYSEDIPLIDRGSTRYKIARLAAALAARTFSCSEDKQSLIVRPCHIEYITKVLNDIYGSPTFGYAGYTAAMQVATDLLDPDQITKQLCELSFPGDFVKTILSTPKFDVQDIQDWTAWERPESLALISLLVRKHAIHRDGRMYRKTSGFILLLKELLDSGKLVDRPKFMPEF